MKNLQAVLKMHHVPKERWPKIVARTALGLAIIALGVAGGWMLQWNQWLTVGVVSVGAHMFSGQILTGSIKAVIASVRELVAAIGGKGDA